MARKRLSEMPPPSPFSSDDEEENQSQEEAQSDDEETDHLATDGEKQEEEDDVNKEKDLPLLKKHSIPATPSKTDSDFDSDSDSTQPSPSTSDFTIKLHKPSPKHNKIRSKRAAESKPEKVSSKKMSKHEGGGGDEEPKKGSATQRLWSGDDELAILEGLNQYRSEKGSDPHADMVAFHEFIKKSLHVDVSKNQLMDKIRRLKKKYQTNIERCESGQDPIFSKTHDLKSFELSKKIWSGNDDKIESVKRTGKVQNNGGGVTLGLLAKRKMRAPLTREIKSVERAQVKIEDDIVETDQVKSEEKKEDKGQGMENFWDKYPLLSETLNMEALSEGAKVILREKLGMIEKGRLKELEQKGRSFKRAELELFVHKMELVYEQVKLALDSSIS